ncbi:MAG: hypothetical protein K2W92_10075 [Alphaproteobacteria bacterium]|nr:hypothetical protein [Alphaproteobacteria bacterium]
MNKELILWVVCGSGLVFSLWGALDFQKTQKTYFQTMITEKANLQRNVKDLKKDLLFIKTHQKELTFLTQKGWLFPHNRLIAIESLEELCHSLSEVSYTFDPENLKTFGENSTFKVTKIVFEVGALLDTDIYDFMDRLLENFPGILIPHELTLSRSAPVNEKNLFSLRKEETFSFMTGKLIFEWVSIKKQNHEE